MAIALCHFHKMEVQSAEGRGHHEIAEPIDTQHLILLPHPSKQAECGRSKLHAISKEFWKE